MFQWDAIGAAHEVASTRGRITDVVIEFAVSSDFSKEEGDCWEAHPEDGGHP